MSDTAPNPVGRPSKYEERFCDDLIAFMGRGYSLTAFAGSIGVARSTINEWMGDHEEFSEAARVGQAARTMALEKTLIAGETGPKVTGHIFALKNADPEGWKEKVAHVGGGPEDSPIQTENRLDMSALTPEQLHALASIKLPADA